MRRRAWPPICRPWNYRRTESGIFTPVPYSLQFDGINDYVSIPSSASLQVTGSQTWGIWVKLEDLTSSQSIITCRDTYTSRHKFVLLKAASNDSTVAYRNQFFIRIVANPGNGDTSAKKEYVTKGLATTDWCLVVFIFTTNSLKVYVNGIECTVAAGTLTKAVDSVVNSLYNNTNDPLLIGASNTTPTSFAKGMIDYAIFINKELSGSEVTEWFGKKPGSMPVASDFSFSSNIVSLWKIGESPDSWGTSGGIKDSVGSNHGTMINFDPAGSFSTNVAA